MTTAKKFGRELIATTQTIHDVVNLMLGIASLVATGLAWWRFGAPWGITTFLGSLLVVALATGYRLTRDLEGRERGQLIPPGWNAIVTGEQNGEGEWVPPGYRVVSGPGPLTDESGNTVVGGHNCRIYGGQGNTVAGAGNRVGAPPWCR